ncbi:MAG: Fe-S oxidoreductase, partial [Sphingomonas bacterium]|nr:Fe-S oxidoreductase [Sphingomonas bacterium]
MTQSKNRLTAMTAIAAVLALATPAIAQDAQPAPVTAAPDPLGVTPPTVEPAPSTEPTPATTTPADPLSATTAVEAAP